MKHMSYEEYYSDVVSRAVAHVKGLTDVDPARIALVGFSMGGFTSLKVAVERKDLKAVVHGLLGEAAKNVGSLTAPVLLLVEASDERNILQGAALLEQALRTHGKEARVIRYNRGGGHQLFYTVDYYWPDIRAFLQEKLGRNP
jgi:dienelactone hydrolase